MNSPFSNTKQTGIIARRTGTLLLLTVLAAMTSLPATAQLFFHLVPLDATISGPNGDTTAPRAHVGESAVIHVMAWNLDDYLDSIEVNRVFLVVHHATGDVIISNLVPAGVILSNYGDMADITTTIAIAPEDGEVLQIDAELYGSDQWNGILPGLPLSFHASWAMQIHILPNGSTLPPTVPPVLQISRASATTIRVSWPASAEGFRLESSEAVAGNPIWTPVPGSPLASGNDSAVTLDASDPARFFRLAK